jgi:hypothetical protein
LSADTDGSWPAELKFLLERHPRATWPSARSASAAFWLDVHERLRRDCAGLREAGDDYLRSRHTAAQLAAVAAPRLRGLIAAMQGHHQIEDHEYFPAFRRAEPRLARGFDLLEAEHGALLSDVDIALLALTELRAAEGRDARGRATQGAVAGTKTPDAELAARRYVTAADALCTRLVRHLGDEEDLVIPLLLARGDY